MSLKLKYFLFIAFIHALLIVLSYFLLKDNNLLFFIPVEMGIIFSLYLSYRIYKAFIRPLKLLQDGTEAIKEEDFNITFAKTGAMEMDQLISVYNQMIHKIREERISHKEQHFFLEKLIDASPNGIVILDYDNRITTINGAARKMLQMLTDVEGQSIEEIRHPVLQAAHALAPESSSVISVDGWKKYKCHSANFIHRGFDRKFLLIEELSDEILEAEKRAYGRVIRMMAHEVNNSIGAVNSILQSVKDSMEENEGGENKEMIEALDIAGGRNQRLNTFMKNFADIIRLPKPSLEKADLKEVLQRIVGLMQLQAAEKNIEFRWQLSPESFETQVDIAQIEQVFINIIKNAMDAIEKEGVILFTMEGSELCIADNGEGIPAEMEANIFKPFYSSKPNGQGIGLTLIKEILHRHDVNFSLRTGTDGWTRFSMEF